MPKEKNNLVIKPHDSLAFTSKNFFADKYNFDDGINVMFETYITVSEDEMEKIRHFIDSENPNSNDKIKYEITIKLINKEKSESTKQTTIPECEN